MRRCLLLTQADIGLQCGPLIQVKALGARLFIGDFWLDEITSKAAAKALGLAIPQSLITTADEVIE
jgi:hypothetical protein